MDCISPSTAAALPGTKLASMPSATRMHFRLGRTFVEGLRELGYVEGQNITIEWRMTPDREQLLRFATELAGMNLDVIVTGGGPAVRAAKQATSTIPIVMSFSGDPVGT